MNADDYDMKAVCALASANVLLEDGDTEGACNRAYITPCLTLRVLCF